MILELTFQCLLKIRDCSKFPLKPTLKKRSNTGIELETIILLNTCTKQMDVIGTHLIFRVITSIGRLLSLRPM